ncbi:hypothetical protein [Paenibacillus sp. Marseille-Q4541]|uniref:hypothetical protein n=1 Tax=Paenibacillus sp. Marseille-Q4541 TaxID=2831522 RepID=UPI001BAB745E|nr:hypothetical protein [Paenibacillus sp. Marseille-Q4541]
MDNNEEDRKTLDTKQEELLEVNNPYGTFQPPAAPLKHSGPGIASLVIGILALIAYTVILALAPAAAAEIMENPTPEAMLDSFYVIMIGIMIFIGLTFNLVGVILAIIGLSLKNRKKIFPTIGMIINGVVLLIVVGFFSLSFI